MSTDPDATRRSDDHNARGIELADRGWLEEAAKEFRRAIELDPGSAHARENLGAVLAEQRHYREALVELLAAVELDPETASVHFSLATFLADHGADMAAEGYRAALALDPTFPDAQLNLGLTLADQQKPEEAIAALGAAVAQAPEDALPRHELALLHMDEDDHRAAIVQLKEVVRLEPERYEGHLDLGICYAEKGFLEEAERCLGRARELAPDDAFVNYSLAALYARWSRPTEAWSPLRRAMEIAPAKVRRWVAGDRAFVALRGLPELEALLGQA